MNKGKLSYDAIPIPEGLDAAIDAGLRRGGRRIRARRLTRALAAVAAALALTLAAANIAPVYAYAADIPVLGSIVRVFHFGSGGEVTDGVELGADARADSVELSFNKAGSAAGSAPHYTVRQLAAPSRVVITLSGVRGMDFEALRGELISSPAVKDVYRSMILDDSRVEINVVLNEGWRCEVTEYAEPASLLLDFSEAGAAAGEVYYLRSEAMPWGEPLALLCEEYHAEETVQVMTAAGSYIVAIGQYAGEQEAEAALAALREVHPDAPFTVAVGTVYEIPEE